MNIGMILERPYPDDIRVRKEAKALIQAGFSVYLLCLFVKNGDEAQSQNCDGLTVHRFRYKPTPLMGGRGGQYVLTFQDKQWERAILSFVSKNKIEILHLHDIPLGKIVMRVARKARIPFVIDMHEFYSEGLRHWYRSEEATMGRKLYHLLKRHLLRNSRRFARLEMDVLPKAARVISVVDESRKAFLARNYTQRTTNIILMNTVDLESFNQTPLREDLLKRYSNQFVILYVGGFSFGRGLETVVQSAPDLRKKMNNLKIVLVGNGSAMSTIARLVKDLDVGDTVDLPGWLPFNQVRSYIKASAVCIVPHQKNSHTDTTIPHKLFQYMSQSKPVIVSDAAPLARIVRDEACGLIFKAGNVEMFVDCVEKLQSQILCEKLGNAGNDACISRYNWQTESQKLIAMYNELRTIADS